MSGLEIVAILQTPSAGGSRVLTLKKKRLFSLCLCGFSSLWVLQLPHTLQNRHVRSIGKSEAGPLVS